MAAMNKELHNFLVEAELEHYYSALKNELKISALAHLKYVKDEDLMNVGMTKPEMRRLKKYYKKEVPHGTIGKIKKNLSSGISNTMTVHYTLIFASSIFVRLASSLVSSNDAIIVISFSACSSLQTLDFYDDDHSKYEYNF